ncbi:hypothetical protein TYRP_012898 [Tyrophagus putrescentiae]|nr:hypothetical protein TYRP_012898 [Tyrophagus putrescentiae]
MGARDSASTVGGGGGFEEITQSPNRPPASSLLIYCALSASLSLSAAAAADEFPPPKNTDHHHHQLSFVSPDQTEPQQKQQLRLVTPLHILLFSSTATPLSSRLRVTPAPTDIYLLSLPGERTRMPEHAD